MDAYDLAPQGVYLTVQGEGHLTGLPMAFVRLAGCSVGCAGCDTNYVTASRLTAVDIAQRVAEVTPPAVEWTWITGGEPLDRDLLPLLSALAKLRGRIALATSGHKPLPPGVERLLHWISVSPHGKPTDLLIRSGDEVKLVPGLNGLELRDWDGAEEELRRAYTHCWVQPCAGKPETVRECLEWCYRHRGWRVSFQGHKGVRIP